MIDHFLLTSTLGSARRHKGLLLLSRAASVPLDPGPRFGGGGKWGRLRLCRGRLDCGAHGGHLTPQSQQLVAARGAARLAPRLPRGGLLEGAAKVCTCSESGRYPTKRGTWPRALAKSSICIKSVFAKVVVQREPLVEIKA